MSNYPVKVFDNKMEVLQYTINIDKDYSTTEAHIFKITYSNALLYKDITLQDILKDAYNDVGRNITKDSLEIVFEDHMVKEMELQLENNELTVTGIHFSFEELEEDYI